jgi:hypothetical protein
MIALLFYAAVFPARTKPCGDIAFEARKESSIDP